MVGPLLRQRRMALGLTAAQVAAQVDVRREYLSAVERGKRQVGVKTLIALTQLFTFPTKDWLEAYLTEETRMSLLLRMAEHLLRISDVEAAEVVLGKLRRLTRNNHRYQSRFCHLMGVLSYQQGRYGRALHWFSAYLKTSGTAPSRAHAEGMYNVALALRKTGQLATSLDKFDITTRMFGTLNAKIEAGYSRLSKANTLIAIGAFQEGLLVYRRAAADLRGDPWLFDCKLGEAICTCVTRSPTKGISIMQEIEKYATDRDRRIKFHHNLGVMYRLVGRLDESLQQITAALQQISPPPRPDSFAELCLCQALRGNYTAAIEALHRFHEFTGPKDDQDVVAMLIMSRYLGVHAEPWLRVRHIRENYECRISTALDLLSR